MKQIKEPVRKSFERLKRHTQDNKIEISASELRRREIINASEPMVHLNKLKDAGWINFTSKKEGNKNPLQITILKIEND